MATDPGIATASAPAAMRRTPRKAKSQTTGAGQNVQAARNALAEASDAGLLDRTRARHFSFRAPEALVAAAMRESGLTSPTELGVAALAMLAQGDPFKEFMRKNRGALGPDHYLEC